MWRNVYRSYQLCCLFIFLLLFHWLCFYPYFPYPLVSTAALWLHFYQTKPAHSSAWFFTLFLCSFLKQCQCKWNDESRNLLFVMHLILSVVNEIERPDEVNCFFLGGFKFRERNIWSLRRNFPFMNTQISDWFILDWWSEDKMWEQRAKKEKTIFFTMTIYFK